MSDVSDYNKKSFLASREWADFQASNGKEVKYEEGGDGAFLLIKNKLFGNKFYYYTPHLTDVNIDETINRIQEKNLVFWRIDSSVAIKPKVWRLAPTINIQPPKTVILDLKKTEDELLSAMRQKTRYNIRLAERKGVSVNILDKNDFDSIWNLIETTTARDGFRSHDRIYYEKMIKLGIIRVYAAEFEGKILAVGIFAFYGPTVTYLHGASGNEHRNVMAPFLLQWEVIKQGKQEGFKFYDFYGIDEDKWPGVTRFKRGFGGKEIERPGTIDVVFRKPCYAIYKILRFINRLVRR